MNVGGRSRDGCASRDGRSPLSFQHGGVTGETIMNIQGILKAYGPRLYAPANARKRAAPEKGTDARKPEQVEISAESEQLQRLKRRIEEMPDVRLEIVSKIKTRIKMNDYPLENNIDEAVKKLIKNDLIAA
ncbi:MAG: hypothetical protein GF344_19190 [Chitinivibrionales bacterium]|nr:hypothetical protein [Chitinivibrionales bacterium]MBD3358749.1 hypothetical protein [Chitinivibrionales bacterium]